MKYSCLLCEKAFSRRANLRRHELEIHGTNTPKYHVEAQSPTTSDVLTMSETHSDTTSDVSTNPSDVISEFSEVTEYSESEYEERAIDDDFWTGVLHISEDLEDLLRRTLRQKREDFKEKARLLGVNDEKTI